jgi:beta-lactamase superfamily II metal-dependent hydrolase
MLKLHAIQAEYGDCFILEYGLPSSPKYILVDGGPETIYDKHLRDELLKIRDTGGKLDLVILSHVDADHITGLLDFAAELRQQKADNKDATIGADAIWHNTFSQTIGSGNDIVTRLKTLLAKSAGAGQNMSIAGMAVEGIGQGNQLRLAAKALGIPMNPGTPNNLICTNDLPKPIFFDNLQLRIVGPTQESLESLRKEWLDWLETSEDADWRSNPFLAEMVDESIPNLSSIMVLAEADHKKILLTGDGRGDHLLQGLSQEALLDPKGKLHVDVLKMPHHGSDRNMTKTFLKTVTADKYVISANGKYGNPDLSTLIWIIEAAKEEKRHIEILATNETSSTRKIVEEYNPHKYGYALTIMKKSSHSMVIKLSK